MEDDERRRNEPPRYAAGPPTIEEQISPFHVDTSPGRTIQGMPSVRLPEPRITSKISATESVPLASPAQVIHVPHPSAALPPDGPTVPDGLPSLMGGLAQDTDEVSLDEMATDPYAGRRVKGVVPAPDAPKIEISKSMEYDVRALRDIKPPTELPTVRTSRPAQPATEVMLPALERQKPKKDRSDLYLALALFVLLFVIAALIAAVAVGVLQRMG